MHTMQVLRDAKEVSQILARDLPKASHIWIASAWASDGTQAAKALWNARARIEALVVGLDFHQTDAAFLRRFRAYAHVHQAAKSTFHPKVYLIQLGERFRCIWGSSNFTRGGLAKNLESNLLIEGIVKDRFFRDAVAFVEQTHGQGRRLTANEIAAYAAEAAKVARFVERVKHVHLPKPRPTPGFETDWAGYCRTVRRAVSNNALALFPQGEELGYLGVAENIQKLFARRKHLAAMTEEQRRQVAGLADGYGYFGNMRGAGYFNGFVRTQPERLDAALSHIPLRPSPVTRSAFDAFHRALPSRGTGVATGSRLLAMKRPDLFMCVDSANRERLSTLLGLPASRMNAWHGYWELHEILWRLPWFNTPRPKGREGKLWDARVALMDAICYEAK